MMRQRSLGLFRHVTRLPNDVPVSAVLQLATDTFQSFLCPNWRPCGRPSATWSHHIHNNCILPPLEALYSAQDRTLWRATVVTANKATHDDASAMVRYLLKCRESLLVVICMLQLFISCAVNVSAMSKPS